MIISKEVNIKDKDTVTINKGIIKGVESIVLYKNWSIMSSLIKK